MESQHSSMSGLSMYHQQSNIANANAIMSPPAPVVIDLTGDLDESGSDSDADADGVELLDAIPAQASAPAMSKAQHNIENNILDISKLNLPMVMMREKNRRGRPVGGQFLHPNYFIDQISRVNLGQEFTSAQIFDAWGYAVQKAKEELDVSHLNATHRHLDTNSIEAELDQQLKEVTSSIKDSQRWIELDTGLDKLERIKVKGERRIQEPCEKRHVDGRGADEERVRLERSVGLYEKKEDPDVPLQLRPKRQRKPRTEGRDKGAVNVRNDVEHSNDRDLAKVDYQARFRELDGYDRPTSPISNPRKRQSSGRTDPDSSSPKSKKAKESSEPNEENNMNHLPMPFNRLAGRVYKSPTPEKEIENPEALEAWKARANITMVTAGPAIPSLQDEEEPTLASSSIHYSSSYLENTRPEECEELPESRDEHLKIYG